MANSETRIVELLREERQTFMAEVLDFLETGSLFNPAFGPEHRISGDNADELRGIRRQLCERDLYELIYGQLPVGAVDPAVTLNPFARRARSTSTGN